MDSHKKAADRADGQAASRNVLAGQRNDSKQRPATCIQIDTDYATCEQSVNGFTDRAVRLSGAQTLAELSAESQRVISRLCRALPPCFKVLS